MAIHSSILAWRITWTEEPDGPQSWGCKKSDTTEQLTLLLLLLYFRPSHLSIYFVSKVMSLLFNMLRKACWILAPHGLQPTRLLCLWSFPGKNTGVDCQSLLQRIFSTQGSNPGLLHCMQILYRLSYREVSSPSKK